MGIVGLPNVGKSSTFNLLSRQSVPAENFPFCTVDPNLARVGVPVRTSDQFNCPCSPLPLLPLIVILWENKTILIGFMSIVKTLQKKKKALRDFERLISLIFFCLFGNI